MAGTARISHAQLICLTAMSQHIAAVLFLPAILAEGAGHGAWLSPTVGLLIGAVPSALLVGALIQYHPRRSFGEIAEACLGRWAGKLVTLILALMTLLVTALILEDVIVFIPPTVLPQTPGWAVGLTFVAVVLYAAYLGGEVLARAAVLILFLALFSNVLIAVGLTETLVPIKLLPLLDKGAAGLLQAAMAPAGWFAEVWFLTEFAAMLDQPRKAGRSLVLGSALGCLILTILTAETLMLFGPDLTAHYAFPTFSLVQEVTFGEFLERIEIVLVTIWLGGMVVKAGLYLWVCHIAFARVLGVLNARKLLPWLAAVALGLTFLNPNIIALFEFSRLFWTPLSLPLSVGIPGLLLAISWWKARPPQGRHDLGA